MIRFLITTATSNLQGVTRVISDYVGSSRTLSLLSDLPSAPSSGDTYEIISQTVAHSGTLAGDGSPTQTVFILESGTSSTDDIYNGASIKFTSGTNSGEVRLISDYVGSTRTLTVSSGFTNTPAGNTYEIYSGEVNKGSNNTFINFKFLN